MRTIKLALMVILVSFLAGCAGITPPTPKYILKKPLGTDSVKLGMTKDRVRDLWGEPNQVNEVKDEAMWAGSREEWVYIGRYSDIPLDAGYLSKTKKLYFDGNNLTNIVED